MNADRLGTRGFKLQPATELMGSFQLLTKTATLLPSVFLRKMVTVLSTDCSYIQVLVFYPDAIQAVPKMEPRIRKDEYNNSWMWHINKCNKRCHTVAAWHEGLVLLVYKTQVPYSK